MNHSPLHEQVYSLPEMINIMIERLIKEVQTTLSDPQFANIERVFITGCGDSHHAALNAELAFEQLAGLPCEPMTAMQFARYGADFLPNGRNILFAISVSGQVSRTAEALEMGRKAGATAVAVTGNPQGALATEADVILATAVPPLPTEWPGMIVPGVRSYVASQLALYLAAIHIGQKRQHLTPKKANSLRRELAAIADQMEATIAVCDPLSRQIAAQWSAVDSFVFCGSGPNYGTALFSAAKVIEAAGDTAVAQDTEEWAHLQYFARGVDTPTFLISAGKRDQSRLREVATAATAIGRRVAIIAPAESAVAQTDAQAFLLPIVGSPRESFSPLLTCLPGILFAACRAQQINEPYFRNFGGGRSVDGGGGISRIRTSERL